MEYSIVVTAHNVGKYISETLESVGNLDGNRYELIILNDSSTDDTYVKILSFAKSRENVSVIDCFHGYPGAVRNEGLKRAKGDYIFFLDGDDAYSSTIFSEIDDYLENHKTCLPDIITFSWVLDAFSDEERRREIIYQNNIHTISSTVWNKVYKNSFLKANDISFQDDIIYEDMEFTVECILAAKMVHIDSIGYYYRVRSDSITHSEMTSTQQTKVISATENILCKDSENEIRKEYFSKFWWYHMEKLINGGTKSMAFQNVMIDMLKQYRIKVPEYVVLSTSIARFKFRILYVLLRCKMYRTAHMVFKTADGLRNLV